MSGSSSKVELPQAYDFSMGRWLVLTSIALVGLVVKTNQSHGLPIWAVPLLVGSILAMYIGMRRSSPALLFGLEGIEYRRSHRTAIYVPYSLVEGWGHTKTMLVLHTRGGQKHTISYQLFSKRDRSSILRSLNSLCGPSPAEGPASSSALRRWEARLTVTAVLAGMAISAGIVWYVLRG